MTTSAGPDRSLRAAGLYILRMPFTCSTIESKPCFPWVACHQTMVLHSVFSMVPCLCIRESLSSGCLALPTYDCTCLGTERVVHRSHHLMLPNGLCISDHEQHWHSRLAASVSCRQPPLIDASHVICLRQPAPGLSQESVIVIVTWPAV